ncbi:unnamed protein product [Meganyctiphanes norvegica]|uniref:Proton-coupled folate transporter n=1 Tax=Meganyctiphanes norvegica TaxID=48144 RepID=A0AAV2PHS4_MEGNR
MDCVSCSQSQWKRYASKVKMEPVLFLQNFASSIIWVASQDLLLEKACKVNLDLQPERCNELSQHDADEKRVQDLVSEFLMYRSIFERSISVIFTLILGSLSDRIGRQLPLLIALTGLLGEATLFLVNSLCSSWPMETNLLSSASYACSGGYVVLLMLAFALIADESTGRERTIRFGILDACYNLGSPCGSLAVGPILDWGGYTAAFSTAIIIYLANMIYVLLRIKNKKIGTEESSPEKCSAILDLGSSIRTMLRRRSGYATQLLLLLVLAMMLDSFPVWGESNVKYLFVKRALDWTHTQYGNWSSYGSYLSVAGVVVLVPLLKGIIGLRDGALGIIGAVSRTSANLCYGFVTSTTKEWLMWTGSTLGCARHLAPVSIRAMLARLAGPNDVGKAYAVMALGENIVPFMSAPAYNAVYQSTIDTMPSTYNFLSVGFNTSMGICILIVTLFIDKAVTANEAANEGQGSLITAEEDIHSQGNNDLDSSPSQSTDE